MCMFSHVSKGLLNTCTCVQARSHSNISVQMFAYMHVHMCAQAEMSFLNRGIADFNSADMAVAIDGLCNDMLRFYTIAFIFTTNEHANKMCKDGGIEALRIKEGTHALTACLRSPTELGWQKNAGGCFRQNVAMLMGMATSDVQAVAIMGIPTRAIEEAGHVSEGIFTIQEHTDELKLLVPCGANGAMYSGAHIVTMYELEPSMLADMRKELAELQAGVDGHGGEEQATLERRIEALQAAEMAAADEAHANGAGEGDGTAPVLSLEEAIKQAVAAEKARADFEEARAEQQADAAEAAVKHIEKAMELLVQSQELAAAEKARADRAEEWAREQARCTRGLMHACTCSHTHITHACHQQSMSFTCTRQELRANKAEAGLYGN